MPSLIWSRQALLDVQPLYRVLAVKNTDAAKRAVKTVQHGIRNLGHQPGIGRLVEKMLDEFREWVIDFGDSGHLVRYRIDADAVTIIAVRHEKEAGF